MSATPAPMTPMTPVAMAERAPLASAQKPALASALPLRVVMVGHVDHGKSSLLGRLFYETGSLPEGRYEEIRAMCRRRGMAMEWAFLTDALQAERDQGVTIDTSRLYFKTKRRAYVLIDAPGHKEFLRNMVTGAASADAALLLVDAAEGVREQTRRHGYLLSLLGVGQVAVVVNKMDLVEYDEKRFTRLKEECTAFLAGLGITPLHVIPLSARNGDGITQASPRMPWYDGPSLIETLDSLSPPPRAAELPLRFSVQDVYRFDDRRIIAGRVESGTLRVGDELVFAPSGLAARVRSLECWGRKEPVRTAEAGSGAGITLEEQIFVERGHVGSHRKVPPICAHRLRARLFWLGAEPLRLKRTYQLRLGAARYTVEVEAIESVIDVEDLSTRKSEEVSAPSVCEVTLRSPGLMVLDLYADNPRCGRFVMLDGYRIAGGGVVDEATARPPSDRSGTPVFAVRHRMTRSDRALRNHHRAAVIWLTGLSGAGKSTLAVELERQLFLKGYQTYLLDGDNLRGGLNSDLGFSPEGRRENIRRVGEVAALMADAGLVVIAAFIAPYRQDRLRARRTASALWHEVYVKASLATCEKRDPKGLYKKARAGGLPMFSGVSAPYEEPENPEVTLDTDKLDKTEASEKLLSYVEGVCRPRGRVGEESSS